MQSKASTVAEYLSELPIERRAAIQSVRRTILDNLDKAGDGDGFEEGMSYGMIGYFVPHRVYPPGYHCNPKMPLPFAGLASQKNHMSVYLFSIYGDTEHTDWFAKAWQRTGKKLDMGKCCIRFKKLDDLALDVIGEAVRRMPARKFIRYYEAAIAPENRGRPPGRASSTSGRKPAGGSKSRAAESGRSGRKSSAASANSATRRPASSGASKARPGAKPARRQSSATKRSAPASRAARR
ncbi:MAG: DUF1801 domain-containing protein [Phycisphaerales bacterium]|nr:DUF1801 domain-containing protein [Phycisphaerales bacterium]